MKKLKKILLVIVSLLIIVSAGYNYFFASNNEVDPPETVLIEEDGHYNSKEDVALYIYTYGCLPENYVTKEEARAAGWSGGSVEKYLPGCAIGGDVFSNYEGNLPKAKDRVWYECDIDTWDNSSRGAKRILYSSDGLIYYTEDHYETFEILYGE